MNICTYVMPVSRKPKLYAVSIEYGSKTLANLEKEPVAVLQLLSGNHRPLIPALGQRSGVHYDKDEYLRSNDWITVWNGHRVLKGAAALLQLRITDHQLAGDHVLFIFEVERSSSRQENDILTFQGLIENNLILK